MKKLILFFFTTTVMFQLACRHGHKTYPDLSGQWSFEYKNCIGFDTSTGNLIPVFSPTSTMDVSLFLEVENIKDGVFLVRSPYKDPNGTNGLSFILRKTQINPINDSISFAVFDNLYGDSIGHFTGKYNNKTDDIRGYFDTWYNIFCQCRFAGVNAPARHYGAFNH